MALTEPRVCLCVLLNHPYVQNLPLLRELYAERFSAIRFLVPFARTEDEDVITVYRGSYSHAAFLTDARRELAAIDCDYFLVIHDDVLLNPRIREATFRDYFPLGPDDGFHPRQAPRPDDIGEWVWNFALVPQLLHPKSILFGGGVEPADLAAFLPPAEPLRAKLEAAGVAHRSAIRMDAAAMEDVGRQPSRVLLHGLTAGVVVSHPEQVDIERRSLEAEQALVECMLAAARLDAEILGGPPLEADSVALPLPVVTGGMYTDLYIVPKSRFEDFSHYMGVASAAHLFVEVMAPTILYAVCDRVWTADQLGLDISGFPSSDIAQLAEPGVVAIHPYKLSVLRTPEVRAGFLAALERLGSGSPVGPPEVGLGLYPFGSDGPFADLGASGWHGREPWGRWASDHEAEVHFVLGEAPVGSLTMRFRAPTHPSIERLTGGVTVNGESPELPASVTGPANSFELVVEGSRLRPGELNQIQVRSDILVCPARLAGGGDQRELGFGLLELEFA